MGPAILGQLATAPFMAFQLEQINDLVGVWGVMGIEGCAEHGRNVPPLLWPQLAA